MPSWTQIANRSLGWLKQKPITNYLSTTDRSALEFQRVYEGVRDEVLAAHPWNCAMERTSVDADTDTPAWGFSYQYTLPTDPYCLRVWQLNYDRHGDAPFKVIGRKIHCDEGSPLEFEYIKRVTDPMQFSPLLARAMAASLAEALAIPLTDSESRRQAMEEKYEGYLREARSLDGQEGTPDEIRADSFEQERF